MRLRLRRRLQLLFVPFVFLLLGHLALDSYLVGQRDEVRNLLDDRLNPARVALSDLLASLVDQETGERGYLITGKEVFLEPYRTGQIEVEGELEKLEQLLDDPDLLAGLERVESRITAWQQLGAEYELAAKRAGRDDDAASLVATGTGMQLFDRARREIESLQAEVGTELDKRQARLERIRNRTTSVRAAAAAVGLAIVLAGRILLERWITKPLDELTDAVRSVATGQLRHPIPATGPPDLEELGRDVEAMRERLLAEIDESATARAALAQRGMVVLALRDELAPEPVDLPEGLEIAARFQPAEGVVAGDWFDTIHLGAGRFAVALFDVSGHGAEAGVFALKTKYLVLGALRNGLSAAASLRWLATQLGDTGDHFLTGVIVEIDAITGRIRYANAGHPPALVSGDGVVTTLGPTGPLLGPLAADWTDAEAALPASATLTIYSDGLIEAPAADGDEFGVERLTAIVGAKGASDPEVLADACFAPLDPLLSDAQRDDITLVVVGRPSAGEDSVGRTDDVGRQLDAELGRDAGVHHDPKSGGVLDGYV